MIEARFPKAALLERIDSLEAQFARLKADNEAMTTRFAIWAYNTHVLGIPDHRLDAPLQAVNRALLQSSSGLVNSLRWMG